MSKFLVVTTFPNNAWGVYGQAFMESFAKYWTDEATLFTQLDDHTLTESMAAIRKERHDVLAVGFTEEQAAFIKRNYDKDDEKDYRKQYCRFSYKVFAMDKAVTHYLSDKQIEFDYLIWLDADVMTHAPVTFEALQALTPQGGIATYLGREDWDTSETGFIMFDLKNGGTDFIRAWKKLYIDDVILGYPQWTDAYAFDRLRETYNNINKKDVFRNLSVGIKGRDVFELTKLGEYMKHYKGNLKFQVPQSVKPVFQTEAVPQHSNQMHGKTFDVNNLGILTQNCVQNDKIKENVSRNLRLIKNWLPVCPYNEEEAVICSAGPSLDAEAVLKHYKNGTKIIAVKHAIKRLHKAGIKPWACILLDPREHVASFVKYPDRDTLWFISSMIDPEVTNHLITYGCKVFGYHAMVNAGEVERIPPEHRMLGGGSGTATRGISLMKALGFKKLHLYGYDCCYFEKPDLSDRKDNGKLRYEEVTLQAQTWGGKFIKRTFWTEGQFLAQVQEMNKIYFPDKELELHVYGDGIIPWMYRHEQQYKRWLKGMEEENRQEEIKVVKASSNINKWLKRTVHGKWNFRILPNLLTTTS